MGTRGSNHFVRCSLKLIKFLGWPDRWHHSASVFWFLATLAVAKCRRACSTEDVAVEAAAPPPPVCLYLARFLAANGAYEAEEEAEARGRCRFNSASSTSVQGTAACSEALSVVVQPISCGVRQLCGATHTCCRHELEHLPAWSTLRSTLHRRSLRWSENTNGQRLFTCSTATHSLLRKPRSVATRNKSS